MGEVDRAHDMSLGRDVAIKVLPDGWLDDQDRRARFDREARTLAALNHPHIASIYGVTEAGRMRGLVLELVDGRTLEEVVLAGLTVPAALSIAAQIALALEAAHEKGIIHRDLKPANIKVSASGAVKVLDFGLARLDRQELEGGAAANLTVTGTRVGLIVGTAAYMSPEQARGAPVDKRTDIWAFGCVVYELLTGTRAFAGATLSDTVAAVLEHEPSWEALPPTTPQSIRRLLQRCLRKDRSSRVHDIADARIEIQEAIANTPHPASSASGRSRPIRGTAAIPWLVAAAAAGTLLVDRIMDPSPTRAVTRLELDMPPGVTAGGQTSTLTLSPDGATAAYIGVADGLRRICVRRFDQFEAKAMPGTERAQTCFFSPDSSRAGFITVERTIKILSLADGLVVPLAGDADYTAGGAWGGDGRITFGRAGALWQLPATGGSASPLTTLDAGKGEVLHAAPAVVDGGRAILFMNMTGTRRDSQRIESVTVGSGERRSILGPGSLPMYSSGGHLVFFRDRALLAASFDATALQVTGPAVRVVEDLALSVEGDPYVAISSVGTLVYRAAQNARRRVVWVGRDGREEPLIQATGSFSAPRLSRDGRYLAICGFRTTSDRRFHR
jgi:serine/threonine protein kinase